MADSTRVTTHDWKRDDPILQSRMSLVDVRQFMKERYGDDSNNVVLFETITNSYLITNIEEKINSIDFYVDFFNFVKEQLNSVDEDYAVLKGYYDVGYIPYFILPFITTIGSDKKKRFSIADIKELRDRLRELAVNDGIPLKRMPAKYFACSNPLMNQDIYWISRADALKLLRHLNPKVYGGIDIADTKLQDSVTTSLVFVEALKEVLNVASY